MGWAILMRPSLENTICHKYLFILGLSLHCLGLYLIALYGVDAQLMPKDN